MASPPVLVPGCVCVINVWKMHGNSHKCKLKTKQKQGISGLVDDFFVATMLLSSKSYTLESLVCFHLHGATFVQNICGMSSRVEDVGHETFDSLKNAKQTRLSLTLVWLIG